MQILILGMHRSGTSVAARLLNMMGVYFAPEGVSNGASPENPKGFWERKDVRALNDRLLHSAGADWHRLSKFSLDQVPEDALAQFKREAGKIVLSMDAHRPWFIKEPRLCLLAPLWLELLEFPVCLLVYRSAREVARSLEMRNHFSLPFGLALWERYNVAALETTRGQRRIQINHADLMATPVAAVRSLEASLQAVGVRGLRSPSDDEILAFIDPTLYRAKERDLADDEGLSAEQRALAKAFQTGTALLLEEEQSFSATSQAVLIAEDALPYREENARLMEQNAALAAEVAKLKFQLEQDGQAASESRKKLAEVSDKLRVARAARDEAVGSALTAEELRKTIQREMKLLREAAVADATNAELRTRTTELQARTTELGTRTTELQTRTTELQTRTTELRARLADLRARKAELAETRARLEQLTARNQIIETGLNSIWGSFDRLDKIRSFHFVVYTARKLGLVSRKARRLVEEIKFRFGEIHRGLHSIDSAKGRGGDVPPAQYERAPVIGPREFDEQAIERITQKVAMPVSIVIPIYNAPEELRRCLESIFANTRTAFELILIDDASPDPAVGSLLKTYETRAGVRVIHNEVNEGFVRSANRGFQAAKNDVVLLNSDTEVTPRWLQKLTVAAYSDPEIATVTPFSNASGAFSVPKVGVNAPIPFPFSVLKMARLTERLSNRAYPGVPTGNGFCMFIKRAALQEMGGFDEENFRRGYAEENDFCMRALKAGWRHVIDDSLFIYHRGNTSFGEEKQALLNENRQTLDRLHPTYTGLVQEFVKSAEINAIRSRIGERLTGDVSDLQLEKSRVLFILAEGGGGVPLTNADLVSRLSATHDCHLLTSTGTRMILRAWENGRLIEKKQWTLPGAWSAREYSNAAARKIYFEVLTRLGIDLVHIRHLFKHTFDAPALCRQLGIPVVLSFHDYYFVCPSVHLLDQNARYCGGQCTPGLEQCTIPSPMLQDLPMLKTYLPEWRRKVGEVLDCCAAFVTTAESVRDVHQRAYPQLKLKPFWVIEHGRDIKPIESAAFPPQPNEKVRILAAGNIDLHKGSLLIQQLTELDKEGLLEFHFLGQTDERIRGIGVHHGPYRRDDFPTLAREIRPAFAAVLSIWPETYSHTLTEAWSAGLPVLGSSLGAVGERIAKHGGGWAVDTSNPAAVLEQIREIVADAAGYTETVQQVTKIQSRTPEEMAEAYRALYQVTLAENEFDKPIRVGCIVPPRNRGSTFVRITLPLGREELQARLLTFRLPGRSAKSELETWISRLGLQTVLIQRDALDKEDAIRAMECCRAKGVRVIMDIDDNLLDAEQSHPDFASFAPKVESIRCVAKYADHVVASTPNLAAALRSLNPNTTVIGNGLDEWLWFGPMAGSRPASTGPTVVAGYMGTLTHGADLELIREPFLRAQERLLHTRGLRLILQIIGGMDGDAEPQWYERLEVSKENVPYPHFVRWLRRTVAWDFGLAPLVADGFNAAKSGLKFFEYAGLGVPGIFSPVGEYPEVVEHGQTGLLASSNRPEEWEDLILQMASSPLLRKRLATNAERQVKEYYLLGDKAPAWIAVAAGTEKGSEVPVAANKPQPLVSSPSGEGKADVVVAVCNALEDVRRCLSSIVAYRTGRLNKLILINDGSEEATSNYLRRFCAEASVETILVENREPAGYTKAANQGLLASEADYVILLNSDTVVTPGWIEALIACGESNPSIGIIGPLSNAASWQSVPERRSATGDWAVNELPLSSLARVARIFSILHRPHYPTVPIVNGFCFAIKRAVINALGEFDEVLFPQGYGEENDFCLRALKAGFTPALADNCYVYHAKSKSYSHERRRKLAKEAQTVLREKYGPELDRATEVLSHLPELKEARSVFARLLESQPCSILFLMNFRGAGGGVTSIVQEAAGLRALGAAVQVAIRAEDESHYRERFPGVPSDLFHSCESTAELTEYAGAFEFVVATLFTEVQTLKNLLERSPEIVPCYYIQDYEPAFFPPDSRNYQRALESYSLIPTIRAFAKTDWLCQTIAERHELYVHKVQPSIDQDIFFADSTPKPGSPFIVCAMVRPETDRRSPEFTFKILRQIKLEFGAKVGIRIFGLTKDDPFFNRSAADFEYEVAGILTREQVAALLREASLFIDASTYQAFGRTGLEAMACRCATILPREGGVSEYAVDCVNTLLASALDENEIMLQVRRYLEDEDFYRSVVDAGLKTASRYSIHNACASELRFFESLRPASVVAKAAPDSVRDLAAVY